ncbi:proline-, glutamic acid- and leucine-rich protein 1-like, partial [Clarias magur]
GQEQEVAIEVKDNESSAEADHEEMPIPSSVTTSENTAPQQGVETAEKDVVEETEMAGEEARGTKRKIEDREEGEVSEQRSEKRK